MVPTSRLFSLLSALTIVTAALPLQAIGEPQDSPIQAKEFRHADLWIGKRYLSVAELEAHGNRQAIEDLSSLGVPEEGALLDPRTGRWGTLMPTRPLLPGNGAGNTLDWQSFGERARPEETRLAEVAWHAFITYLDAHQKELGIEILELAHPGHVAVHNQGEFIHINAPRVIDGIPVQDSFLTAVIRHGNLILLGAINWGDIEASPKPALSATAASAVVRNYLSPLMTTGAWSEPSLAYVPLSVGNEFDMFSLAEGLAFRLVWVLSPQLEGALGRWQAPVDASDGELLLFQLDGRMCR